MLSLAHVRSFVAVVDSGSFTHAAHQLVYSVPAVTSHVRSLEKKLGVALLERVDGRYVPTVAGRRACEVARTLLRTHDDLVAVTRSGCRPPRREP